MVVSSPRQMYAILYNERVKFLSSLAKTSIYIDVITIPKAANMYAVQNTWLQFNNQPKGKY